MADRIRLVVLYGGRSAEHEVSCVTAVHVLKALDPERYDVVPIGITREGNWVADRALAGTKRDELPAALEARGQEILPGEATAGEQVVVLPLLHGPFGEDGTVQGLLEMAGVPYVGSGVLGSALAMDKAMAKDVLAAHGLPQARWMTLRADDAGPGLAEKVGAELGWPVFVKPANLGSSVGVSKAEGPRALADAVTEAASFDEWLLIEEAISGREIEVAVLGNRDPE